MTQKQFLVIEKIAAKFIFDFSVEFEVDNIMLKISTIHSIPNQTMLK